MAIDTSLIQDTDWLACTDDDGITYKVSGANFKKFFLPPVGFTLKIDTNLHSTGNTQFDISTNNFGYPPSTTTATVDWGDGNIETIDQQASQYNYTHNYASAGTYTVVVKCKVPILYKNLGTKYAACITSYRANTGYVVPALANNMFQFLNVGDDDIATFDWSTATELIYTFFTDFAITSVVPNDYSSAQRLLSAWNGCTNLTTFPANQFDTTGTLEYDGFDNTWFNCALTSQSIENILVSLDTNGQSNINLGVRAGTNASKSTWSATANAAYDSLIGKGWTITYNP